MYSTTSSSSRYPNNTPLTKPGRSSRRVLTVALISIAASLATYAAYWIKKELPRSGETAADKTSASSSAAAPSAPVSPQQNGVYIGNPFGGNNSNYQFHDKVEVQNGPKVIQHGPTQDEVAEALRKTHEEAERKKREAEIQKRKRDEYLLRTAHEWSQKAADAWAKAAEPFNPRNCVGAKGAHWYDEEKMELHVEVDAHWQPGMPSSKEDPSKLIFVALAAGLNDGFPKGPRSGRIELVLKEGIFGGFTLTEARRFGQNDALQRLDEMKDTLVMTGAFLNALQSDQKKPAAATPARSSAPSVRRKPLRSPDLR